MAETDDTRRLILAAGGIIAVATPFFIAAIRFSSMDAHLQGIQENFGEFRAETKKGISDVRDEIKEIRERQWTNMQNNSTGMSRIGELERRVDVLEKKPGPMQR